MKSGKFHKTLKIVLAFVIFNLIFQFGATSPVKAMNLDPFIIDQVKELIEQYERAQLIKKEMEDLDNWLLASTYYPDVPSSAVCVIQDGKIAYKKTVRSSDDRLYQSASFTKTFIALAILQLAGVGAISLDDPLSDYLPCKLESKKFKTDKITVRHMLNHTSGLGKYGSAQKVNISPPIHMPKQRWPAGYRFNYCNQGYNLLGRLITEVSGLPLGEYITQYLLVPMEMFDTVAPENMHGAGGIRCSISDMGNYISMFLGKGKFKDKQIIKEELYNQIFNESVGIPPSKHKEFRGVAFRVWTVEGKPYSMNHASLWVGSGGWMQMYPSLGVGYVFLTNTPDHDTPGFIAFYRGLKFRLLRLTGLLSDKDIAPLDFKASVPIGDELKKFAGIYKNSINDKIVNIMVSKDNHLTAEKSGLVGLLKLYPTTNHTFVYYYPGQLEKGLAFDFIWDNDDIRGLALVDGFYVRGSVNKNDIKETKE